METLNIDWIDMTVEDPVNPIILAPTEFAYGAAPARILQGVWHP